MAEPDLIIIGAGPAGMAAAATAAKGGARVLLLDEQPRPGGQIYRGLAAEGGVPSYLGQDYVAGRSLVAGLGADGISVEWNASVWRIDAGPRVVWSRGGASQVSRGRYVLLAGGAQERPMPFPGWTLPGVMTAGAAQILMKTAGLLPRDAVLAGSGPLLYLIAAQLIDAGAPPQALVETQSAGRMARAAKLLPRALPALPTLLKGLGLIRRIRQAGVPRYTGAEAFRAETSGTGIAFSFRSKGRLHRLETPLLLTHHGVIPASHMGRAAGVAHDWDPAQQAYRPRVDAWGRTDVQGVHLAGDGAGIGGADAAKIAGRLAALDILHLAGHLTETERDRRATADHAALKRALSLRPFLDAAYAPSREYLAPEGDTIVCRCEEVTAEALRRATAQGATGPRQAKTATRAGMGPCQGRMCENTLRAILEDCGAAPTAPRARSPIKPVALGELAGLAPDQDPTP